MFSSVTVTAAPPARSVSVSDDGDVIVASGSATAVTSIPPVVRSPLPVCPEFRTRTLSFASSSKSPVNPRVKTAAVSLVLLTLAIVTPEGLLASSKSAAPSSEAAT